MALGSRRNPTTDEVLEGVNLTGKRVLVTGVSAGLGVETARALAAHGARSSARRAISTRRKAATETVRAEAAHGGGLELVELDLASLESVRACADALVKAGKPFDLVIANAGVMACPKGTDDGRLRNAVRHQPSRPFRAGQPDCVADEAGFAAGEPVVGGASLLRRRSRRSRISSTRPIRSSAPTAAPRPPTSFRGRVRPAAQGERRACHGRASRRHPDRTGPLHDAEFMQKHDRRASTRPIGSGRTGVQLENHSARRRDDGVERLRRPADEVGGRYCEDCHVAELPKDAEARSGVRAYALDADHAKALWAKSEEMVGERF